MNIDRAEIKKRLGRARSNLDYRKKHASPEVIAATQAEVDRLAELYADTDPARRTMRVRSPYFIGPRRERGVRGGGPTIVCFRCEVKKPVSEYYAKGTVCKCCTVKRAARWSENNPEKANSIKRKYAVENRDKKNAYARAKYWSDPEAARQRNRDGYDKDACNEYQKKYISSRRKRDPAFRAFLNCKARMHRLMTSAGVKKKTRSAELIGLQRDDFLAHIASQWLPGMSWENYGWGDGKWVIDHLIPAAYFDHRIIEQQKLCWNYKNLRPMWWRKNLQKSDKLPCGSRARDKKMLTQ